MLPGIGVRAKGTVAIAPFLGPPPEQSPGGHHLPVLTTPCEAKSESALAQRDQFAPLSVFLGPCPQITLHGPVARQPAPLCTLPEQHIYWQVTAHMQSARFKEEFW